MCIQYNVAVTIYSISLVAWVQCCYKMPLGFLSNGYISVCILILCFFQSQTPIASLISLSSTEPGDKVVAPLTSTPVTTLGCANHITPKSLCGPVNIESVGSAEVLCMHTSRPALCYSDVAHWLFMHVLWLECSQSCTSAFISLHRPLTWNSLRQPYTFSTRALSLAAHPFTHCKILARGHGCTVM